MKNLFLLLVVVTFSNNVFAQITSNQILDFERDRNGESLFLRQEQAISYCAEQSKRLPTIRELAEMAQRMGAVGISEIPMAGYQHVLARNLDGTVESFFYNGEGFAKDLSVDSLFRNAWIASSSFDESYKGNKAMEGKTILTLWYGTNGSIGGYNKANLFGVICIPN